MIDSSATVELLTCSPRAAHVQVAVGDAELVAPDVLNLECLNALRRLERATLLSPQDARRAVVGLAELPIKRVPTDSLIPAAWELRHNLSPYDGAYVALAQSLDCPLLTFDQRLAAAPFVGVEVIVPRPS